MKMLTLLGIFIFSISALAMNGRTTYQAKIIKPDGYPLEASSVNFRFSILDYSGSCVIYVEDYTAVNMGGTGGLISFALGAGTRSFPASGTAAVFQNAFDNSVASFPCQSPGIYNPLPQDGRKIVMQFHDGNGWQTLPAMTINAVPYAMYAAKSVDSKTLNGKADTAFVENSTLAALNCNPATHAITFNGVSFSCIAVGASGGGGITSVTTSGTVLLTGGTASAPVISIQAATMSQDGYLTSLDYAEFKAKLSASSTEIINTLGYTPVSSSTVASQIASSTLAGDVSGNPGSNTVDSVGGKPASQVSTSVDDTLAATSSATADTIVKRNSLGNFTANDIYANAAKINYVDIYKPLTSFSIRLQAPTSLSTNYVLNLPTTSGTTGQVLSTDGTGNLSWISPTTGSVVSVSATAPLASTGGSNPTISITQSSSSTDGYLSSSDWTTFNNKQQATSSAIIATLGYTPADNAASGTYAQKANNLSDLTNIPQARTNLGLGTLATGNSIDLGSASATGIIADARLQTQSNVTSGTQYTKVTVDGKGRVTSGAQLSSNDVTSALGYTPADNAASGTYLVKASNLSDLANVIQARSNLGLGGFATISSLDLGSASATGTLDVARLPSFNGDATIAAASNTIVLSNSGVSAGTYSKVTVDAKGRVTSSSALSSSDITTALGYTPATSTTLAASFVQKTGDTMTGTLNLVAGTTTNAPLKLTSGTLLSSAQSGTIEYDGSQLYFTDGFNARRAIATNSSQGSFDNTSSISNSSGNITLSPNNITGSVIVNSSAASISSGTGALVVNGGVGIAGSINAAGNLNLTGSATIGQSLSLSSMTSGSLLFAGASGLVSEDNSRLFWDGANKRLGLGTNSPAQTLSVSGTSYFSGNVGIGISSATAKLEIAGASSGWTSNSWKKAIKLEPTSSLQFTKGVSQHFGVGASGSGGDKFYIWDTLADDNSSPANYRFTIVGSSGNIGIGLTNPTYPLEVSGAMRAGNSAGTVGAGSDGNAYIELRETDNNGTPYIDFVNDSSSDYDARFVLMNDDALQLNGAFLGINILPTAGITIAQGTSIYAPLKFTSGTLLASPQSGTMEYDGYSYYLTDGANQRRMIATGSSQGAIDNTSQINSTSNLTLNPTGIVVASSSMQVNGNLSTNGNLITSGSLGVGQATPGEKLDVNGNMRVGSGDSSYIAFRGVSGDGPGNYNHTYIGERFYAAPEASELLLFKGNDSDNASGPDRIRLVGGNIVFDTYNTPDAPSGTFESVATSPLISTKMIIKGNGNVGIGTTAPENADSWNRVLDVNGLLHAKITASTANVNISMNAHDIGFYGAPAGGLLGTRTNHPISFYTSSTTRMMISSNGNVGIGTTSPGAKFEVFNSASYISNGTGANTLLKNTSSANGDYLAIGWVGEDSWGISSADASVYRNLSLQPFGGNVGIGTTAPGYTLHVVGTAGLSTGTAWTNASDRRLKDIQGDYEYGLNEILKLHTVRYNYKKDNALGLPSDFSKTGFIAQEVQKVIPDAVNVRKDGYLELNVDPIHWAVVNAVKDLYKLVVGIKNELLGEVRGLASIVSLKADKAEIEVLKAENAELKAKDEAKSKRLESLEAYLCSKDPNAPICK